MIKSLVDKMVFGVALIISMQLPSFIAQYEQYLNGYYDALTSQVTDLSFVAKKHDFEDAQAMLIAHSNNPAPSVSEAAQTNLKVLTTYTDVNAGIELFQNKAHFQKIVWMLHPNRVGYIDNTLEQFTWSIPINKNSLLIGFIGAFVLSILFHLIIYAAMCIAKPSRKLKES